MVVTSHETNTRRGLGGYPKYRRKLSRRYRENRLPSRRRSPRPISGSSQHPLGKRKLNFASPTFRASSLEALDDIGREGMAGLELFVPAILVLQVSLDLLRVLQNERDRPVYPRQRTNGRIRLEDRLGRPTVPKVAGYNVQPNGGSGDPPPVYLTQPYPASCFRTTTSRINRSPLL
jgi:hypothetical protein